VDEVDEAAPVVRPTANYMRRTLCDPHEDMFALRAHGPLIRIEGNASDQMSTDYVWQAMGYDVVRKILGDHENFTTRLRLTEAEPLSGEGTPVPPVLLSGNHAAIARWRRMQALGRTRDRRPELWEARTLTKDDQQLLAEYDDRKAQSLGHEVASEQERD